MTFLEKRLVIFFESNMHTYLNKHGVELEMSESCVFTASSVLKQNIDEDWYLSVSVESGTPSDFVARYAIGKLPDLDNISPVKLQELYNSNQGTFLLLFQGKALWFSHRGDNSTLVTGDLQAITSETLIVPADFLRVGQQLIQRSGLPGELRIIHSKK